MPAASYVSSWSNLTCNPGDPAVKNPDIHGYSSVTDVVGSHDEMC